MPLPKSTFVMGVLTLGLFGVAVYKTAADKTAAPDEDEVRPAPDDLGSGMEYDQAKERREEAAAQRAENERDVARSFGAEVAQPGEKWAGRTLEDQPARFEQSFTDQEACDELRSKLSDAWGPSKTQPGTSGKIWANEVTQVRAIFEPDIPCSLTFEKFATPEQWISKARTAVVSLGLVGSSMSKLAATMQSDPTDGELSWRANGLGIGPEPTELTAYAQGDRITMVTATVASIAPSIDSLVGYMKKTFGAPKIKDTPDGTLLQWPAHQMTLLYESSETIRVTIGKR